MGKTVEEEYQKKTQLEHVLLRPDTYIGSIEQQTTTVWLIDDSEQQLSKHKKPAMVQK